ncbi:MAG: hypothetical protein GXY20_12550 [Clostridiales bacterium]|nr:hypothetical protein [Clostridiales bacterium]
MSSLKIHGYYRRLCLILCVAIIAGILSSCGGLPQIVPADTDRPGHTHTDHTDKPEPTDSVASETEKPDPTPESTPIPESRRFAEGIGQVLTDAFGKSDTLTAARLDFLFSPGLPADSESTGYTKSTVNLTSPQEDTDNLIIIMESFHSAVNSDAASIVSIQSGSEVAQSGGVYFTGPSMLIKSGNVETPMILHTYDSAVADSLQSLPALARFSFVLSGDTEPKLSAAAWNEAIDTFLTSLLSQAAESDFATSKEAMTIAGTEMTCAASTLSLAGNKALSVTRGFASLLRQDPSLRSMFITSFKTGEDEYGITGLDGVLRDIDTLPAEELTVRFKLIAADRPIGMRIYAATAQKSFFVELLFYEDGFAHQNNIVFRGFDGSAMSIVDSSTSMGGDSYEGQLIYESLSPGKIPSDSAVVATQSTLTENSSDIQAEMTFYRAPEDAEEEAVQLSGYSNYSQEKSGGDTFGYASGEITVSSSDEDTTLTYEMNLEQYENPVAYTVPEFLPAAGTSTSDRTALFAALSGPDPETFSRAPLTIRLLASVMFLFI